MKQLTFYILLLLVLISCRKESIEFFSPSEDEQLNPNSSTANLMAKTSLLDGSKDNIIDRASCLTVIFPVEVEVDDSVIIINSLDDLTFLEQILDEENDDDYSVIFPMKVITPEFSTVTIENEDALEAYVNSCSQDGSDEDIECIDFVYPITFLSFNINTESIDTYNILNDNDLYYYIKSLDDDDVVAIEFPLIVETPDSEMITISNIQELENTLDSYQDFCDEDDDIDFRDDDCNSCTPSSLLDILTQCVWTVDKLERYDYDYDSYYEDYWFQFYEDGSITVNHYGTTSYGTFTTEGEANSLIVTINIPDMPYCNNNWRLHKIEDREGEIKINLRKGENDRMRYESYCN